MKGPWDRLSTKDNEYVIECQHCGHSYIRHYRVDVYEREDDSPGGRHILITQPYTTCNEDMTGNPSWRRHGLRIHLECEACGKTSKIAIHQHKGQTFLERG